MGRLYGHFTEEELKQVHLFRFVSLDSIKGLIESCSMFELEHGMIMIRPGETNHNVYFLLKGKLRVHLNDIESKPIVILGPGESVGEMSVIDQQPTSAFVVAHEHSRIMAMDEDVLWSLVQTSHAAACNLLFILTKRLRYTDSIVVEGASLEQVYQRFGTIDALTGFRNRRWVDNAMKRQFVRSLTDRKPFSLILIGIDYFQDFNSRYGRQFGDNILYSVAHILGDHLRPTEMIARYEGDEFIIVLPGENIKQARAIADRLRKEVGRATSLIMGNKIFRHPTVSIGIAEKKEGQSLESLVTEVEKALYNAKASGRNCVSD